MTGQMFPPAGNIHTHIITDIEVLFQRNDSAHTTVDVNMSAMNYRLLTCASVSLDTNSLQTIIDA